MRKFIISLLILVFISNQTSANAVFGLSTCEKVKKSIQSEESVGLSIWQDFDRRRDGIVNRKSVKVYEYVYLLQQQVSIYESDLIIFSKANSNPKCFNSKLLGKIRLSEVQTKSYLKDINSAIKQFEDYSVEMQKQNLGSYALDYLRSTYSGFSSIYKWKY
jgi:hypothetical protein